MQQRTRWTALFATLMLAVALPACGDGGEEAAVEDEGAAVGEAPEAAAPAAQGPVPEGATAEMVAQGQQIFTGVGNCFTCHGMNAQGTQLAPNLADQTWLNVEGTYQSIIEVVNTGVPQPVEHPAPMPPMGGASLTEEQVRSVAAYVYSISHQS